MSPGHSFIKKLANIPVTPGVSAHSIIVVDDDSPLDQAGDGVVKVRERPCWRGRIRSDRAKPATRECRMRRSPSRKCGASFSSPPRSRRARCLRRAGDVEPVHASVPPGTRRAPAHLSCTGSTGLRKTGGRFRT
jgi:hypothetical protein